MYIYIYQQGFSTWGLGVIPSLAKNLLLQNCRTWDNSFPHQRLIPSPVNKNVHVINQQKLHF